MSKKPNIIFFDIETTPLIITKFQYDRSPFIKHENIQQDWYIICAAWKTLGEKRVHTVQIKTLGNDRQVVKELRDALAKADIIVGHAIDRFDVRNLNARLAIHNLPPLPHIPTVDTLKMAKKIGGFSSNRLDWLSKILTGKVKIKVDNQLWLDVLKGSKKALKEMVEYNRVDVIRNEAVYERLLPYMKSHPHVGVLSGLRRDCSCPNCGSSKIKFNGTRVTAAGIKKQEIQCQDCGSYTRIPITITQ